MRIVIDAFEGSFGPVICCYFIVRTQKVIRYSKFSLPLFQIEGYLSNFLYLNQNTYQICIPVR